LHAHLCGGPSLGHSISRCRGSRAIIFLPWHADGSRAVIDVLHEQYVLTARERRRRLQADALARCGTPMQPLTMIGMEIGSP
jgi:hypothetical protein